MKLGDSYRLHGDLPGAYGPPDPPEHACPECGATRYPHDLDCPRREK